mmetsp:Transcript_27273/g.76962  ORF Transcript_27273/g.76962 Transcript_27273/m.76962 type:complete len:528 (+) Transcript_27273:264-1847(+)
MAHVAAVEAASLSTQDWAQMITARKPTLIRGLVDAWPALKLWHGLAGLDRLARLSGDCPVQVLEGSEGGRFYGSITNHSRESCSFREFLDTVRSGMHRGHSSARNADVDGHCHSPYLAQAPITSLPGFEQPLTGLLKDISVPEPLRQRTITACNLWMNSEPAQSSTHYDPYHNLLCLVTGHKTAVMHSPKHTAALYPEAAFGEACNHSKVDFSCPDLERFPLYYEAKGHELQARIQAGDALFIPEGWWHQIGSEEGTIAVNFWWKSETVADIGGESNTFFLREALAAAVGAEKAALVKQVVPYPLPDRPAKRKRLEGSQNNSAGCQDAPCRPSRSDSASGTCASGAESSSEGESSHEGSASQKSDGIARGCAWKGRTMSVREEAAVHLLALYVAASHGNCGHPFAPQDDTPAQILAALEPAELCAVLLQMVDVAPKTLEALLLECLSPMAVELLTLRFEEMDSGGVDDAARGSPSFFHRVYSVCGDHTELMRVLVRKKEAFSAIACQGVLSRQLGLNHSVHPSVRSD